MKIQQLVMCLGKINRSCMLTTFQNILKCSYISIKVMFHCNYTL